MIAAGVIGWPVAHSKSPLIHRFWLAKLGIDGDYSRFAVAPENLGEAVRALPKLGLAGVNVTVPHKVAVMAHLDRVDPLAAAAGAVNTVVANKHGLTGYNTDVAGVCEPLGPLGGFESIHLVVHVQIIGAGGAARAAVIGAQYAGCDSFDIYARDLVKAESVAQLAETFRGVASPLDWIGPLRPFNEAEVGQVYRHIIINATTLGMTGNDPVPIDLTRYYSDTIVFDMVYAPLETPLLKAARARGLRTIDGLQMLVAQAAAAFELFYGQPAPREHDAELRALLTA